MGFADGALRNACVALLCVQLAISVYYFALGLRMLLAESLVCNRHMKGFTYLFFWLFDLVWAGALLGVCFQHPLSVGLAVASICVSAASVGLAAFDQGCFLRHVLPKEYGPVFFLRGDGVNVHWAGESSKMMIDEKVATSALDVGRFHNFTTEQEKFTYGPENAQFERIRRLDTFQVVSDLHCGQEQLSRLFTDFSGLTLNLGDLTSFGTASELQWALKHFSGRQLVFCPGNHELFGKQLSRMGFSEKSLNFCVPFDNAAVVVLTVQHKVFIETANVGRARADAALEYLNNALEQNREKEHVFIAVHVCPFLSDGDLGPTDEAYAQGLLEAIKAHPNVRAVFSGHDHLLSAFRVGNCFLKMAGPGGRWHVSYDAKKQRPPRPGLSGAPFHLFTEDRPHMKTLVAIGEHQIVYRFVDIMDGAVVQEITQNI